MRAFLLFLLLASVAANAAESPDAAQRFSGSAGLSVPPLQSVDQRFQIRADLLAAPTQASGRFALNARLRPDASSVAAQPSGTQCTVPGDRIFAHGFDN